MIVAYIRPDLLRARPTLFLLEKKFSDWLFKIRLFFIVVEDKLSLRWRAGFFLPTLEFEIIIFIIPTDRPMFVLSSSSRRTIN